MKVHYKAGYKYQVIKDYTVYVGIFGYQFEDTYIVLTINGYLTLKAGYASDGPSGPTVDTKNFMRGAFVHDALYQLIRRGILPQSLRKTADVILKDICTEDGMNPVRVQWVYWAVRSCGGIWNKPENENKVRVAP